MRKFLASVGSAKWLGRKDGKLYHIADIKTLTESTLSFSSSMEEVRAGEGAQLYGRFNHSAGMTITLTDAMFDLDYIAQQVGAEIGHGGTAFTTSEQFENAGATVTLTHTPGKLGESCGLNAYIVWVRPAGCAADDDDCKIVTLDEPTTTITVPEELRGQTICVDYLVENAANQIIKIASNFVPSEGVLIITTKLFAADSNAETGKPVGTITIKIPRFQLDGTFDLSMAMTSAASFNLNGTALAVSDGTCDGKGIYAEIVEVDYNRSFLDGLKMIAFDPETVKTNEAPVVYGLYGNSTPAVLDNGDLTFTPALTGGKITATSGTLKVVVTGHTNFTDNCEITSDSSN